METARRAVAVLLLAAAPLIGSAADAAAETPGEAVLAAVEKMKASGSLLPLTEKVAWDVQFEQLDPEARRALGYSSSDSMKEAYRKRIEANGEDVAEKVKQSFKEEKAELDEAGAAKLELVKQELQRQQQELRSRISETMYEILSEEIDGAKATVKVKKTYRKQEQEVVAVLHQVGTAWRLESAAPLNPLSGGGASPVGTLLTPEQALFQP